MRYQTQTLINLLISQLTVKDQQIAAKDQQIAAKDQQIAAKDQQIAAKDQQLATALEVVKQFNISEPQPVPAAQGTVFKISNDGVYVNRQSVGRVVGTNGATIQKIQREAGISVRVSRPEQTDKDGNVFINIGDEGDAYSKKQHFLAQQGIRKAMGLPAVNM